MHCSLFVIVFSWLSLDVGLSVQLDASPCQRQHDVTLLSVLQRPSTPAVNSLSDTTEPCKILASR